MKGDAQADTQSTGLSMIKNKEQPTLLIIMIF